MKVSSLWIMSFVTKSANCFGCVELDGRIYAIRNSCVAQIVVIDCSGYGMFLVIGEFLLCCLIIVGSVMLGKSYPKLSQGAFLVYMTFVLFNYFIVRWRHEWLKRKVMKFKKMRRKVSNYDFGLPNPIGLPPAQNTTPNSTPKKPKSKK